MKLLIGNKNLSSWSLRAWLVVEHSRIPCDVEMVPLNQPETRSRLAALSPSAKVPVLIDGPVTVWDSLAIAEYLAEKAPNAGVWPTDRATRATARALAAEMHAGFPLLRQRMSMDLSRRPAPVDIDGALQAEIDRIVSIWSRRDGEERGEFLFGNFGAVDAFFLPVATRFKSYAVPLGGEAARYFQALLSWPAYQRWLADAEVEMGGGVQLSALTA